MNESIFIPKVLKKFQEQPLSELLSDNIYLLEEYDIDINIFSKSVKDKTDQKNFEILYLSLIDAATVLDTEYVQEISTNPDIDISTMEKEFFKALEALPELALENMKIEQDSIQASSFSEMSNSLQELNETFSNTLAQWFENKRNGLTNLLQNALSCKEKERLAQAIVEAMFQWRSNYLETKQRKINEALLNIDKIQKSDLGEVAPLEEEEMELLFKTYYFYSPYYELSQMERVPIELALEIAILLKETQSEILPDELLRLEERSNIYIIEYLKLINAAERDRNILLHALNSFTDFIQKQSEPPEVEPDN